MCLSHLSSDAITAAATVAATLVALGGVLVAALQFAALKKANKTAADAAAAASASAKAAQASVDSFVASERGRLELAGVRFDGSFEASDNVRIVYNLLNVGRTAVIIEESWCASMVMKTLPRGGPVDDGAALQSEIIVQPGLLAGNYVTPDPTHDPIPALLNRSFRDDVLSGALNFVVWGYVRYRTVLGHRIRRNFASKYYHGRMAFNSAGLEHLNFETDETSNPAKQSE